MMGFQSDLFPRQAVTPQAVVPAELWEKLAQSAFRQRFHLNAQDMAYLREKGLPLVLEHGQDFIARRLAPSKPFKDGRQTPWKGHPVFVAQHATGTCCRSCLAKWHSLPSGRRLSEAEQDYILGVLAHWLTMELERPAKSGRGKPAGQPAGPARSQA